MEISGKNVWFITGASSGFGKAFTEYAIEQGYHVVITARSIGKLEQLKAIAPNQVEAIQMDVTNHAEVAHAVNKAIEKFGRIDVLINNAGYGIVGAAEETPEEELRAQMETNFFGAVSVTKEILPHLRKQKSGAIVNISSLGGQLSYPGFSAYSASKFALEGYSEALAGEMAPFNVKVLIVEPGAFRTGFAGAALKHMPIMEEYQPVVGGTREFAHGMNNSQAGDPAKAAIALDLALNSPRTPLRLQLGEDAVSSVKAHAENLLTELAEWQEVALNTKITE